MEIVQNSLSAEAYCGILRQKLDSPFRFWDERVTGIVIGPFFSIAHYAQWEWNRRITCECNRAWGIVRKDGDHTQVRFIRGKGLFSPSWLVFFTLFFLFFLYCGLEEMSGSIVAVSVGIAVFVGLLSAFQSSITETGEAGAGEITKILQNPEEYYC